MTVKRSSILALVLMLVSLGLRAQVKRDSASLRVGIYAGYYISGNETARYYAGTDNNRLINQLNNPNIRPQIIEALGNYNFTLAETAQDMVYNNAFAFELSGEILLRNYWYISARFINARLTASGVFTLDVQRTPQGGGPPNNLEQVQIGGQETRSHIDLGLGKQIELGENLYFLLEGGFDLNFVEVVNNEFFVNEERFVLPTFTDPLNPQANPGNTVGTGFYAMGGIGYELPSGYGFWLKGHFQQTRINVNRTVEDNLAIFTPAIGFTKFF